jgi:putative ABC transport system permease protein
MILDYLKIALQSLKKRKIRTWLTMLGIFIGIAAVVSLISLGNGLEKAVVQQFQALGADRIVVQAKGLGNGPPGTNVAVPLTDSDLRSVRNTQGVALATGRIITAVKIDFKKNQRYGYLVSMPSNPQERAYINEVANYEIELGRDLRAGEKSKVVMGNDYLTKPILGRELKVGDTITIQGKEFQVVGFYKRVGSFQVDGTVVMNEDVVREILNDPTDYSFIQAAVSDPKQIDYVADRITEALRKERHVKEGKENFTVQTTQQLLNSLKSVLNIVTYFLVAIAGISLVVGGVGITNTMYTSVLERTKDIGIMKAIGARNSDILQMFLFEAGMLGLVGGLIGIALGVGLGKAVEFIATQALGTNLIQATFSPMLIIGALIFAFVVGALAGIMPAIRAAKMSPVDALRKN